jgi:hypothetical protein
MSEILDVATSWWALPLGVLICGVTFGFMPGFLMRHLVIRLWPKDHPRRAELIAELYVLGHFKRALFVFQSMEVGLSEGLTARIRVARAAAQAARRSQESDDELSPVDEDSPQRISSLDFELGKHIFASFSRDAVVIRLWRVTFHRLPRSRSEDDR